MKKFILTLILLGLMIPPCFAEGWMLYQNKDLKVGIDEITGFLAYDVNHRDWLTGGKSSVIQYKQINFDIGIFGDIEELDDTQMPEFDKIDTLLGLSADMPTPFVFKDKLYANLGIFYGDEIDGKFDKNTAKYGAYAGLSYKF